MDKIATGVIRTTHGVRGQLKVKVFSDDIQNFLSQKMVFLHKGAQEKQFEVEKSSIHGKDVLIKLKGIDTPEVGKTYNGWEIWIPREHASPLEEGEYYQADLHGCTIVYREKRVGEVVAIIEGPQADLLEVRKTTDGVCYIPFMDEYISDVDMQARTIELRNEWIVE